ncbi:Ldh family oxidoreductase [Holdemania massiliensis]|uniref:Ldh family oxidoreductase n=1 Tax=Holdemania massiliensis TaxID=1468449 RepID=UPI001F054A21|nr:Ldh family oxidoreductase [Holdemania massiliensis]MCH1941242.1 Ldh family oxidoreductase [Holdemania massiliensis]
MMKRCNEDFIREKALKLLISREMPVEDARIFIDSMISADLCGISTHGIRMLPIYVEKIEKGNYSYEEIEIKKQFPAFTIINSKNTIGAISANKATDIAIEKAKTEGIHTVFAYNSNTFGSGLYFVEKIANAGQIGFICCNSPAAMPAFNGLEAMLGTNPLAFASPSKSYGNITLDMATSVVAKSKFGLAKANGEKLESGWAIDKEGNPTIDPDEAMSGFVLPTGGFKGYGIAMIIDILSGFLSGAAYLNKVRKFYSESGDCMNVGHLIIAINPEIIYEGDFKSDMDRYIEILKNSNTVKGKEIVIPGDRSKSRKLENKKLGIILSDEVIRKLEYLFDEKMEYA